MENTGVNFVLIELCLFLIFPFLITVIYVFSKNNYFPRKIVFIFFSASIYCGIIFLAALLFGPLEYFVAELLSGRCLSAPSKICDFVDGWHSWGFIVAITLGILMAILVIIVVAKHGWLKITGSVHHEG